MSKIAENSESQLSTTQEPNMSNCFIDDYSHLRLSYYQHRMDSSEDIGSSDHVLSSDDTDISLKDTCVTEETDLTDTSIKIDERQKLRDYYISQIPDLPHPAFTVASIIASASQRMGGVHFKYNDRIEQGNRSDQVDMEFSPSRRSTLIPGQFVGKK